MSSLSHALRRVGRLGGPVTAALAVAFLLAVPAFVAASPPGEPIGPEEQEVVDLVNAERAKVGAAPLTVNYSLMEAAWVHNEHMVDIGRICHSGCGDGDPGTRIAATGYRSRTWGENVAAGYPNPIAVMDGWMHSSGHRANILNTKYTDIGVAYSPTKYWTQVFAAPASGYMTVTPPAGSGGGAVPTPTPCTMARDFDGDSTVTMTDVDLIKGAFMATASDPRWDARFDLVPNGLVDLYDIVDVMLALGETGCNG